MGQTATGGRAVVGWVFLALAALMFAEAVGVAVAAAVLDHPAGVVPAVMLAAGLAGSAASEAGFRFLRLPAR